MKGSARTHAAALRRAAMAGVARRARASRLSGQASSYAAPNLETTKSQPEPTSNPQQLADLDRAFKYLRISSLNKIHTDGPHLYSEPPMRALAISFFHNSRHATEGGANNFCNPTIFAQTVRTLMHNHSPARSRSSQSRTTRNINLSGFFPSNSNTPRNNASGSRRPFIQDVAAPTNESSPKLSFGVAASYSAKQKRYEPASNTFNFNPYLFMKASSDGSKKNRPDTGQDAFFVSRINDSGGVALGVADGVGGYSHYGIDSADFAHTLCENMAAIAHEASTHRLHPRTLLNDAYTKLMEDGVVRGGASTACAGTVRTDGVLMVANLGDSGFIILRGGRVVHASAPQTHAFNTPYQLSLVPKAVLDQSRMFGGDVLKDMPKDAQVSTHNLRHGDVVVFATDGVWDNLAAMDVLRIVGGVMLEGGGWVRIPKGSETNSVDQNQQHRNTGAIQPSPKLADLIPTSMITPAVTPEVTSPESSSPGSMAVTPAPVQIGIQTLLARAITGAAKSASLNTRVDGPFAKEVKRLMPQEHFSGGKRDDICVVCLVVVDEAAGK